MRRIPWLLLLPALILGCAGQIAPPAEPGATYRGVIKRICSPVDASGYQLDLALSDGEGPNDLTLYLWSHAAAGQELTIELSDPDSVGSLWSCQPGGDCQPIPQAYLRVTEWQNGRPIAGQFWSGSSTISGAFKATVVDQDPLICG